MGSNKQFAVSFCTGFCIGLKTIFNIIYIKYVCQFKPHFKDCAVVSANGYLPLLHTHCHFHAKNRQTLSENIKFTQAHTIVSM